MLKIDNIKTRAEVEAYLLARSEEDPLTGCWIWAHAVSGNGQPRMALSHRSLSPKRWAYRVVHGDAAVKGRRVMCTNGTILCVCLDHLKARTPAEANKATGKLGRFSTPAFKAARLAQARSRTHVTAELVEKGKAMRQQGAKLREIAAACNVSMTSASRWCNGQAWRTVIKGASVFNLVAR